MKACQSALLALNHVAADKKHMFIPQISVLVVEDEPLVRMNMVMHLEEQGFLVAEAANAEKAIGLLEANDGIHLIFTDIDMPGSMDGLKLSAYVRRRWPPIHIIVTSGKRKVDISDLPDGSLFFSKPYQLDAVVSAMREMSAAG